MEENKTNQAGETHEHTTGCFYCKTVRPTFQKFWTEATENHFKNARLEFLRGMRSFLDDRIEHLSKHGAKGTPVTVE